MVVKSSTLTLLTTALIAALAVACSGGGGSGAPESDTATLDGSGVSDSGAGTSDTGGTDTGAADTAASDGSAADAEGSDAATGPDRPVLDAPAPLRNLSDYAFFVGPLREMRPNNGVFAYTVNAPLWSDNAYKGRFIALPEGTTMTPVADTDEDWQLPIGTIVIKSFFFDLDRTTPDEGPYRINETRLLFVTAQGIKAETYLWNDAQTDAVRFVAGTRINMPVIGEDGVTTSQEYVVPNKNQCANCHTRSDTMHMLGLSTAQLNREANDGTAENQIARWQAAGLLTTDPGDPSLLPAYDRPFVSGTLNGQARAYLHGNCSHCHRTGGAAGVTGLWLLASVTEDYRIGICKGPVAAGAGTGSFHYDILPGHPERSIMPFRMSSVDPEIKMPEIPNLIADRQGVALIEAWIAAMPAVPCNEVNDGSGAGSGAGSGSGQ